MTFFEALYVRNEQCLSNVVPFEISKESIGVLFLFRKNGYKILHISISQNYFSEVIQLFTLFRLKKLQIFALFTSFRKLLSFSEDLIKLMALPQNVTYLFQRQAKNIFKVAIIAPDVKSQTNLNVKQIL